MVGESVTLTVRTPSGRDSFNNPVYTETTATVADVLIGQPTAEEAQSSIDLYGKRCEVMLGIPKGDTHDWEDTTVTFWGHTWHTIGPMIMGIEANVPTRWHRKIRAARDE